MTRKYEQKQRAAGQEATRRRIVEAAVELHESVGGEAATVTAIADRAGVGRLTVYRHFPDERSLLGACTGHYLSLNPPPSPAEWAEIADREERVRAALAAVYAYFERTEGMMARAENESPTNAVLAELMTPFHAHWATMRDQLAPAWSVDDAPNPLIAAAIGHALAFTTWRSLARLQGLSREHVITLMVEMVRAAARCELG
jgi:AcrR family transcriptional regulator